MPYVPCFPAEPFGAWLRSQAGTGSPAGQLAGIHGADIGAEATPGDVAGIIRTARPWPDPLEDLIAAVREWLAESIPVTADALRIDPNLISWPVLTVTTPPGPPPAAHVCVLCGDTFPGRRSYVTAATPAGDGFACRPCTGPIPGGEVHWTIADAAHQAREVR